MPKPNKTVQEACRQLIDRVRYKEAKLRLPGSSFDDDDTLKIQLATEVYVDTWIVPLIEAIRDGSTYELKRMLE
jgi:hypothetical protein